MRFVDRSGGERVVSIERLERRRLLALQAVGPWIRVNAPTTGIQHLSAVAVDADGDAVVTWQSLGQGFGYEIHGQRYLRAGTPGGGQFRANTHTPDHQRRPAVATSVTGDYVVLWDSAFQDSSGPDLGVYAQRFDASGVAHGSEFRVNTHTTSSQFAPAVAMDASGDFVVAWASTYQEAGQSVGAGIYAQQYDAAGAPRGDEFRVNTYTTLHQSMPSVAMDADGDFVIVWESGSQDGSSDGVYAQRFSADGAAQGTEFRVNTYTQSYQEDPHVAMDEDGDFIVAWESYGQDGSRSGVYARRYDAAGKALGAEFRVNTYTTNAQDLPCVAADPLGNFIVTWTSRHDGSGLGVYAQRFNRAGVALGGEFRVNAFTLNDQSAPSVAAAADGDPIVTWTSFSPEAPTDDIHAQRYAAVPLVTASSFLFNTAPQRLRFTLDEDVSGSLGADDLIVRNLTTSQTFPATDFSFAYDAAANVATVSYVAAGGVLPDGRYCATLLAAGVYTPNGNTLPADHVFEFRFLMGDANNDGVVNLIDFNILAANFGQSPRDFTQGDFNYDGRVNLADFNILAGRFGAAVVPHGMMRPARAHFGGSDGPQEEDDDALTWDSRPSDGS